MSSATPGAKRVSPAWRTVTSVPSGKTVSRWPPNPIARAPVRPLRSPITFPSSSVHTESAPVSRSSSAKRAPRSSSMKGGAGISVSSTSRSSAQSSCASARRIASATARLEAIRSISSV